MRTSAPTVRAVFLVDAAALIGIVIAVVGIAGHQLTELRLSLVGAGKVFLSGAVDLVGNADERTAAIQLLRWSGGSSRTRMWCWR